MNNGYFRRITGTSHEQRVLRMNKDTSDKQRVLQMNNEINLDNFALNSSYNGKCFIQGCR